MAVPVAMATDARVSARSRVGRGCHGDATQAGPGSPPTVPSSSGAGACPGSGEEVREILPTVCLAGPEAGNPVRPLIWRCREDERMRLFVAKL